MFLLYLQFPATNPYWLPLKMSFIWKRLNDVSLEWGKDNWNSGLQDPCVNVSFTERYYPELEGLVIQTDFWINDTPSNLINRKLMFWIIRSASLSGFGQRETCIRFYLFIIPSIFGLSRFPFLEGHVLNDVILIATTHHEQASHEKIPDVELVANGASENVHKIKNCCKFA